MSKIIYSSRFSLFYFHLHFFFPESFIILMLHNYSLFYLLHAQALNVRYHWLSNNASIHLVLFSDFVEKGMLYGLADGQSFVRVEEQRLF